MEDPKKKQKKFEVRAPNMVWGLGFRGLCVLPTLAGPEYAEYLRWTPHPVIVTIKDKREHGSLILLLYHYYRVGGPPKEYHS